MAVRTISNAGGNWNATTAWVEGAVPTAADDVVATATSGNLTINVAASCRSFNMTSYVGTLTHAAAVALAIGDGTAGAGNVALKLVSGMTYTLGNVVSSSLSFNQAHTTQQTIDLAGKTCGGITLAGASGLAPSWLLQSDITMAASASFNQQRGTLDTNGFALSIGSYTSATNFSGGRALTLRSSTVTLKGSSGSVWNLLATGHNLQAGTSTIVISDTGASAKTFTGGGVTYNNLSIATGGAGSVTFADGSTFAKLNATGGSTKTVVFTSGTTTTLTGGPDAFLSGAAGNLVTIQSSAAASAFTVSKVSGVLSSSYLSLKDSTATGGAAFYAGGSSTNVSGNTGWTFAAPRSAPPSPRSPRNTLLRR